MEDSVPDLIDCDQVREKSDKKYEFEDDESEDEESIFKNKMDKIITDLEAQYPKEDEESDDKKSESEESEDVESVFKTEIDKIITDLDAEYPTFCSRKQKQEHSKRLTCCLCWYCLPRNIRLEVPRVPGKKHCIGPADKKVAY